TKGGVILKPYASVSNHSSDLAGYTETGGTFAGTVTNQSSKVRKARIGLETRYRARPNLELTGGLSFDKVSETGTFSTVSVGRLGGAAFGGGSGARSYNTANISIGLNSRVSRNITLHTQIDMTRALTAGASDVNIVAIKLGATVRF
ncbi:MAG: autotransporter domain-containing protein, partial [Pseudomonadota bacterium]